MPLEKRAVCLHFCYSPTCCHGGQCVSVNNLAWRGLPALTLRTLLDDSAETEGDQTAFGSWRTGAARLPWRGPAATLQEELPAQGAGAGTMLVGPLPKAARQTLSKRFGHWICLIVAKMPSCLLKNQQTDF